MGNVYAAMLRIYLFCHSIGNKPIVHLDETLMAIEESELAVNKNRCKGGYK